MGRQAARLLLLSLALAFGVVYGVTVTREGLERVYGPLGFGAEMPDEAAHIRAGAAGRTPADGESGNRLDAEWRAPAEEAKQADREPDRTNLAPGARIAGKAGDLLRLLADGLIRLVVRLGEAVLS